MRCLPLILALLLLGCDSQGINGDGDTEPTPDMPAVHDRDGDTISDEHEGYYIPEDTDGDTIADADDLDSDNDTIPDQFEAGDSDISTPPRDSDDDGIPDFRDEDSDDNGIPDSEEGVLDRDDDGVGDFADRDNDGDMIIDDIEIQDRPEDPPDTDGDGTPDLNDIDSDGDTISDLDEQDLDTDEDLVPDRLDQDTDDDTIPDFEEAGDDDVTTPPVDTDGDFTPDFRDFDSDADGLSDAWEREHGLDPYNEDSDMDGCPDLIEVGAGTDPLDATSNPRTVGNYVFIMYYNEPDTPDDEIRGPDPTMDHLVFVPGLTFTSDLTVVPRDDPGDHVDTVAEFIEYVEADTVGGWPDPSDPHTICEGSLEVADRHLPFDRRPDTFTNVSSDVEAVCFTLYVKPNFTVPGREDTMHLHCALDLVDNLGRVLDTVNVYFVIPRGWIPGP